MGEEKEEGRKEVWKRDYEGGWEEWGKRREGKWREKVHTLDLPAHAAP